jgi:hypothetical protein
MSIPLDRLYHYLADVVNHDLVIYRWAPHGSRKLEELTPMVQYTREQNLNCPVLICHDQEPLNYNYWNKDSFKQAIMFRYSKSLPFLNDVILEKLSELHLRSLTEAPLNYHDRTLLLHSELDSIQVQQYSTQGFIPVYYWSHALIAEDWFRYAQHDPLLQYRTKNFLTPFLVYNRAWAGTREYRLYFTQQLIDTSLLEFCNIKFNPDDSGHYQHHKFQNSQLQITRYNLEQHLPANSTTSCYSADYVGEDYATCAIEVVLETLFDDQRLHLTEKTLRPLACGKPFILCSTPGSLKLLRQYGFKTFAGLIDESYDKIENSQQRLLAITAEMQRIVALPREQKHQLYIALHEIAKYNQQVFFNQLHNQVIEEFQTNMNTALKEIQQYRNGIIYNDCNAVFDSVPERQAFRNQNKQLFEKLIDGK